MDSHDFRDLPAAMRPAVDAVVDAIAAGRPRVLLLGPPGVGKTMLARRLTTILPPLSDAQRDELTAVYKAGRLLNPERDEERFDYPDPPFRAPHHTVSTAGLVGRLRWPGEIGLARHGVLFLDDLPEFAGMAIDRLRGALDDAPVILVASSNPCPCGWHGHSERECSCSPSVLGLFGRRLDRYCAALGIATRVPMPPRQALTDADRCPPSAAYRLRLMRAAKEVPCASGSN